MKRFAVATSLVTACLGVLVTYGYLTGETAGAIGTIVAVVVNGAVTHMAANATPPAK